MTPDEIQLSLVLLSSVTGLAGLMTLLLHASQSSRPSMPLNRAKYARS